jgi:DNA repair photolyase
MLGADRSLFFKKMKTFKGKAIYNPSGKAGEYSYWACNFYKGCSNGCTYCYLKKGVLAHAMGGNKPELKACFKNEENAMEIFKKELEINIDELKWHGLFFTFTSDPLLYETKELTMLAINECLWNDIPVKLLTKCTKYISQFAYELQCTDYEFNKIAFGLTLTGHDELEPNASTNVERIEAMKQLHEAGFKTFASIEPIIDLVDSFEMISATNGFCDLYKIGLLSGAKYDRNELQLFVQGVIEQVKFYGSKIYFKDTLLKLADIERSELPDNCVDRDYYLFKEC